MARSTSIHKNTKQTGQALVEYALILIMIALAVMSILSLIRPAVGNVFSNIMVQIQYGPEGPVSVGWGSDDPSSYFPPGGGATCNNDGTCGITENYYSCPADCPLSIGSCNNGVCETGEDQHNCAADCDDNCGGDNLCTGDEDSDNCPDECLSLCNNDGICSGGETPSTCSDDCGCNSNGTCEGLRGETTLNCSADCGCNNDGTCQPNRGENSSNCPADCSGAGALPDIDCSLIQIGAPSFSSSDRVSATINNGLAGPIYIDRIVFDWTKVGGNSNISVDYIRLNGSYIWGRDGGADDREPSTDTAGAEAGEWPTGGTIPVIAGSGSGTLETEFDDEQNFSDGPQIIDDFDYTVYFTNSCIVTTTGNDLVLTPEPTPVPDCGNYTISPVFFDTSRSDRAQASIANNSSRPVEIVSVVFDWPKLSDTMYNDFIQLGTYKLWGENDGGRDEQPPTDTAGADSAEWLPSGARNLLYPNSTVDIYNDFDGNPDIRTNSNPSQYKFTIQLSNGCLLESENLPEDTVIYIDDSDFARNGNFTEFTDARASTCFYTRAVGPESIELDSGEVVNSLTYNFETSMPGQYSLWFHGRGRNTYCDYYYYSIDGGALAGQQFGGWGNWYWREVPRIDLQPGSHTLELWAGDGGGGSCGEGGADLDAVVITNDMLYDPQALPCDATAPIWAEAENGTLNAPAVTLFNSTLASACRYVQVPEIGGEYDGAGWVEIPFEVPIPGEYMIWGRGWGLDGNSNSVWVSMDGDPYEYRWHMENPSNGSWDDFVNNKNRWDAVHHNSWGINDGISSQDPLRFTLDSGAHIFRWRPQEDGALLDAIIVVMYGTSYTPYEEPVACGGSVPTPTPQPQLTCGGDALLGTLNNLKWKDEWQFTGAVDTLVTVTMRRSSGNLDPYLQLLAPDGSVLVEDDDHGRLPDDSTTNQDAELAFILPSNGIYTVVATRYNMQSGSTVGGYTLSMECTPLSAAPISCGGSIEDVINEDAWFNLWEFGGVQGTELSIWMGRVSGSGLDPYLILLDSDNNIIMEDDNSGSGDWRNARIDYTLPDSGLYTIMATRKDLAAGGSTGGYRLEVACGLDQQITCGDTMQGTISDFDSYDYWEFDATAGDLISIVMERNDIAGGDLDPYLELYKTSNTSSILYLCGDGNDQCKDDDRGVGNSAVLNFHVQETTSYTVKARRNSGTGTYDLKMVCHEPQPITCGQTVTGSIDDTDFLDRYVFVSPTDGPNNGRVRIYQEVASGSLDSKIYLWRPNITVRDHQPQTTSDGTENATIYDPGQDGLTLDASGTWEIWATRYTATNYHPGDDPSTTGEYSLTLQCDWEWTTDECAYLSINPVELQDSDTARALITNTHPYFRAWIDRVFLNWPSAIGGYNDYIHLEWSSLWGADNNSSSRDESPPTDSDVDTPFLASTQRYIDRDGDYGYVANDFDGNANITTYAATDFQYMVGFINGCEVDTDPGVCGDGLCTGAENPSTCSADCPSICGDSFCTGTETTFSCPVDCDDNCGGDHICSGSENYITCPSECEPPPVVRVEMESGTVAAPQIKVADLNASGCYYVTTPENGQSDTDGDGSPDLGKTTVTFEVPASDRYVVWAHVLAPDGSSDSFWVSLDGGAEIKWFVDNTTTFAWDRVMNQDIGQDPVIIELTAGTHSLAFRTREDGVKIDVIDITNELSSSYVPGAVQCTNPPLPTVRVNAGGSAYTDLAGNSWLADAGFNSGSANGDWGVGHDILNTNDDTLYQWYKYIAGNLTWSWTVPNGNYAVRLHFAENYHELSDPPRNFHVEIEGVRVATNYSPWDEGGGKYAASVLAVAPVSVNDGQINIAFIQAVQNPAVGAIEVFPCEGAECQVCGDGRCGTGEDLGTCPEDCAIPPVANFTFNVNDFDVNFTTLSTGTITSWSWDFGDSGTSADQNPSHTYGGAATYPVTLTVTGPNGTDSITKNVTILAAQALPVGRYEQTDSRIVYTGNWLTFSWPSTSGGSLTYTNDTSATASFKIDGAALILYRTIEVNRGPMEVCIDGNCQIIQNYGSIQWQAPVTFSGLGSGIHYVTIRMADVQYIDLDAVEVLASTPFNPIRINVGGSAGADVFGNAWEGHGGFVSTGGTSGTTTTTITGTPTQNQFIYQKYFYMWPAAEMKWERAVPDETFKVRLHFMEPDPTTGYPSTFDIRIEGTVVASSYKPIDFSGQYGANFIDFNNIAVSDGTLNIDIVPVTGGNAPSLAGIEVIRASDLWPARVSNGLLALYTFDEGSGSTVTDTSGFGIPLNLTIDNPANVRWVPDALIVDSGTFIGSASAASKIINAIPGSQAITIEAWVRPATASQTGPARIVTLSQNSTLRNFTLGQDGNLYQQRFRTSSTDLNGTNPSLSSNNGTAKASLQHIVYTRNSSGAALIYIDGVAKFTLIGGSVNNWDPTYRFALASEVESADRAGRYWLGTFHTVAIYNRALTTDEITQNFKAGPQ
ncbi:MAG: PKD domain-containing protein [Anaerolineae bacterium]|nr:PKD domain-containing protein [Anaerolineae bacterium]